MVEFIVFVTLMFGSASMGFQQGQENVDADNLLNSKGKVVQSEEFLVDTVNK